MSIGKKCDRCGKFYVRNQVKQENGRYIIRAALIDSKNCVAKRWDICDECAEKLQAFMSKGSDFDQNILMSMRNGLV